MKITQVCAWCGKELGEIEGEGVEGVSHGMCEECSKNFQPQSQIRSNPNLEEIARMDQEAEERWRREQEGQS